MVQRSHLLVQGLFRKEVLAFSLRLMSVVQRELPFEKDVQFRDLCVWTLESEKNLRGLSEFYTRTNFG